MKAPTKKHKGKDEARSTNRRRDDQALEESESYFRRLLRNIPDIVYSFSDKTGGLYYSPRVEDVLG